MEEVRGIQIQAIDTGLMQYRLPRPHQVIEMNKLIAQQGQIQPVVLRRAGKDQYQLIDGFKRYQVAVERGQTIIKGKVIEVSEMEGKVMMMMCNRSGGKLQAYEEGLILHSLHEEDGLEQQEISRLTGYSRSWVSRRISLIEKTEQVIRDMLRLGEISPSQARVLIKLPCGNQGKIIQNIQRHGLSCQELNQVVEAYLQTGSDKEREYLLNHPREVINQRDKKKGLYDVRLGEHGNRLVQSIDILFHSQVIFLSTYQRHETGQMKEEEREITGDKIVGVIKKSREIIERVLKKQG